MTTNSTTREFNFVVVALVKDGKTSFYIDTARAEACLHSVYEYSDDDYFNTELRELKSSEEALADDLGGVLAQALSTINITTTERVQQ